MGALDPISPVVEQYNQDKGNAQATPTATPEPKIPEKEAKAPEEPKSNVVNFPQPTSSGSNTDEALREIGHLERQRDQMQPPRLQLPEKPKTAKDNINLWGSLAIAFAAIASRRTRTPMTTALNAAAAALNGMAAGQKEQADQAYKEWEQQTKIALETADYEQRAYQELMNNITRRENLVMTATERMDNQRFKQDELNFKTTALALKDAPILQAWNEGMAAGGQAEALRRVAGLYEAREKQKEKLKELTPAVQQAKIQQEMVEDLKASPEWKEAVKTGDRTKQLSMLFDLEAKMKPSAAGRAGTMFSDQDVDTVAKRIVEGKQPPPTAAQLFGRYASPSAVKVMEKVNELDPEYSTADWSAFQDLNKRLIGKAGDEIRPFTVLTHHLAFFDELAKRLKGQTDVNVINKIINNTSKEFGEPEMTNFDMVKKYVGDEANKAILGTPGGVADRDKAEDAMAKFTSPEQLAGVSDTLRRLAQGQLAGRLTEYQHFIDKGWIKPDQIVPTNTMKELGINYEEAPKFADKKVGSDNKPSNVEDVKLDSGGMKLGTKNSLTPDEVKEAIRTKSKDWQERPLAKGGMAYSKDGKTWFDAEGKQLGQ